MNLAWLLLPLMGRELTVEGEAGPHPECPNAQAAQLAIKDRVGDAGPGHVVRHLFVTDTQSGQSYVRLRLFDPGGTMLLERLIPVEHGDCDEVPLAMAIILDNYFENLNAPTTSASARPLPAQNAAEDSKATPRRLPQVTRRLRASAGVALLSTPAPALELNLDYFYLKHGFVHLALQSQVFPVQHRDQVYTLLDSTQGMFFGSGVQWSLSRRVAWAIIPELGLHYQRVQIRDDEVIDTEPGGRFVPSVGARADFHFRWGDRFAWGLGGRVDEWLGGTRWAIARPHEPASFVLALPTFKWDFHLFASYWF